jgi:hypothetical protein
MIFITSRSSRISIFSLARSKIDCCDSFEFNPSRFVENTVAKPQSISWFIVDLISMGEKVLVLSVCFFSCVFFICCTHRIGKGFSGCERRSCEVFSVAISCPTPKTRRKSLSPFLAFLIDRHHCAA